MANELAVRQSAEVARPSAATKSDDFAHIQRVGNLLAASGYFNDARDAAQAAVKVMAGQELGLPPIASMMGINIIKGKVAMSANIMAVQIKKHGYGYRIDQLDGKGCSLTFFDRHGEVLGVSSFTEEDAKLAGIISDNYRKYPRNMYFARAMSNGAKWYCPDAFGGAPPYTPEELGAKIDPETGEMEHEPERRNTKAQQAEFAQQRIEQLKREHAAEDQRIAEEVLGCPQLTDAQIKTIIEVQNSFDASQFKSTVLPRFGEIKASLEALAGPEQGSAMYYEILEQYGVKKSTGFEKRIADAKLCYEALVIKAISLEPKGA